MFSRYVHGRTDIDTFLHDASCVSTPNFDGSEALFSTALRALLPEDTSFPLPGEPAMGDTRHAGFLREDSVLVLLFMTDEDDSSACTMRADDRCVPRCVMAGTRTICAPPYGDVPVYVDGLSGLRAPGRLVVAGVGGMPVGLSDEDAARATLAFGHGVICGMPGSTAPASVRLVQATQDLGGLLHSICDDELSPLMGEIAERVGRIACDEEP